MNTRNTKTCDEVDQRLHKKFRPPCFSQSAGSALTRTGLYLLTQRYRNLTVGREEVRQSPLRVHRTLRR
jgi:hypothetical protein